MYSLATLTRRVVGGCIFGAALLSSPARADAPAGRFVLTPATATDVVTNLTWRRDPSVAAMTLDEANAFCGALPGGFRVPTLKELLSIVDWRRDPALDPVAFPTTFDLTHWTSTADTNAEYRYVVSLGRGYPGVSPSTSQNVVRCVK